jgi:hypothetical protein
MVLSVQQNLVSNSMAKVTALTTVLLDFFVQSIIQTIGCICVALPKEANTSAVTFAVARIHV